MTAKEDFYWLRDIHNNAVVVAFCDGKTIESVEIEDWGDRLTQWFTDGTAIRLEKEEGFHVGDSARLQISLGGSEAVVDRLIEALNDAYDEEKAG